MKASSRTSSKSTTSSSMSSSSGGNGDAGGGVGVGGAGDGTRRGSSTMMVAPSSSSSSSHARTRPPRFFRLCTHPGCSKQVQQGGVCCRHGARTSRTICTDPSGCTNVAKRGGLCRRHGAFRLGTCGKAGCKRVSRTGGYCDSHQPLTTATEVSSSIVSLDDDDGDIAKALSSSPTCDMQHASILLAMRAGR